MGLGLGPTNTRPDSDLETPKPDQNNCKSARPAGKITERERYKGRGRRKEGDWGNQGEKGRGKKDNKFPSDGACESTEHDENKINNHNINSLETK